jgi:alkylhydroperoxidase family enzyme
MNFQAKGENPMAWVKTISEESATGKLAEVFARVRERSGKVPNIATLQSLRPATMEHGFGLYCQIMDDPTGISKRERVLIATVVSKVNGCLY